MFSPLLYTLGLHMRPAEFVIAVKYRLWVLVFSEADQCPACNHHSDVLGDHAISCGNQGERIARHDSLRDAIYVVNQTACLGRTGPCCQAQRPGQLMF